MGRAAREVKSVLTEPRTWETRLMDPLPGYRRTFERRELKYVIDHVTAERLLEAIGPFVRPDAHNGELGFYPVVSLYYDSAGLSAYHDKLDGVAERRKVRVRVYPEVDRELAFLEIKERARRTVRKRRRRAPLGEVLRFLSSSGREGPREGLDRVGEEALALACGQDLRPKVLTLYNRQAWFGRYEEGLRITFDRNLRCRKAHAGFAWDLGRDPFLLSPGQVVLEVKCNERVPGWVAGAIAGLDLRVQRFSKYCHAIETLVPV